MRVVPQRKWKRRTENARCTLYRGVYVCARACAHVYVYNARSTRSKYNYLNCERDVFINNSMFLLRARPTFSVFRFIFTASSLGLPEISDE